MTIRQDLRIQQNADWSYVYTHRDSNGTAIDLTGYSAAMSIKRVPGQTTVARAYLSSGADANGGTITLGGIAGTVTLSMTAAQTLKLLYDFDLWALIDGEQYATVEPQCELVYDLNLTSGVGSASRVMEGNVIVRRSVTP
jgi:hypothetical protein